MFNKLKLIHKDQFFKNNFILFCGSMIVAVFNYLYHPILGRIMSIKEFGELQVLLSLLAQMGIISMTFQIITVNIVSNQKMKDGAKEVVLMLQKIALYIILAISCLIIIFSPYLQIFFHFDSVYPFIILAIIPVIGLLKLFRNAILQGMHNFKELSIIQIIHSSGKLFFSVVLIYFGWSLFGAIFGIIIAQVITLVYATTKTMHFSNFNIRKIKIDNRIKKELQYGFLIAIVILNIIFLYTVDIMIVKHYFSSDISGMYSGVSVIARIIFFITGSITGVLLPSIKIEDKNGNNDKILKKSIFLVLSLGGTTLAIFSLFPEFIINILIGNQYLDYASLLPKLSLLLFLTSLISLLSYYFLAIRDYRLIFISIIGVSIIIFTSFFNHDTPYHIINNFLFGAITILGMLILLFIKNRRKVCF